MTSTFRHILVSILLTLLLAACGKQIELVSAVPENDGNEVMVALLNAGLRADKRLSKEGVSIWVDEERLANAIDILREQGLPRQSYSRLGDVFKKENLISSPLEERARYIYALSQEIERTLGYIDGVIAARVHVVTPERAGPGEPLVPSSAAVFIKYQLGYGVEGLVPQVRGIVTHAISGLTEDKVSVAMVPSKTHTVGGAPQWVDVFMFRVEQGSAPMLRFVVGIMIVFLLGSLCFVLWSFLQRRFPSKFSVVNAQIGAIFQKLTKRTK